MVEPELPQPLHSLLARPSGSCLTCFDFTFMEELDLYADFKMDLLNMMLHNRSLQTLRLSAEDEFAMAYPGMTSYFCNGTLPKLKGLLLYTGTEVLILTVNELELWGATGGWDNLIDLALDHALCVPAFLGKTHNLKELAVAVDTGEDSEELSSQIEAANLPNPFGTLLSKICFFGPSDPYWEDATGVLRRAQRPPQYLLKPIPTHLTTLSMKNIWLQPSAFSPHRPSLDVKEIRAVARLLPELEPFDVDVGLYLSPKNIPIPLVHIFEALAQVRGPIKLHVFLHVYNPKLADFVFT